MKTFILTLLAATALNLAATPLTPGHITVDFAENQGKYTYTPDEDQMLTFSNRTNVTIYTANISPAEKRLGETYRDTLYVQVQKGIDYSIDVVATMAGLSEYSFDFDAYASPWPAGGESWDDAIALTDKVQYISLAWESPAYLTYTAPKDGIIELYFNSSVTIYVATEPKAGFSEMTHYDNIYQPGGGFKCQIPDAKAGTKYYILTPNTSGYFLCRAQVINPGIGETPEFPFTISGDRGEIPAEVGTYFYRIPNLGVDGYMEVCDDGDFIGGAQMGQYYYAPQQTSENGIHIRYNISSTVSYYWLIVTRTEAAKEPSYFTVTIPYRPTDVFPGQPITEGEYTTPDFPENSYYYSFTIPTDGRSIVKVKALNEYTISRTTASIYFADNRYSVIASGERGVDYEGQPGREYSLRWFVAQHDAPLTFSIEFVAPAAGESMNNPLTAYAGQNAGWSGTSTTYFKYTATVDGWLSIKPDDGCPAPQISMLPIPSDPYMQACEVLEVDGTYRVACTAERGYLLIFNSDKTVNFHIGEISAQKGESASNPLPVTDGICELPEKPGTYWFEYTTPRAGKLDISTNLPFTITENRVDYTYVRIYLPSDPDNFIAQLRPDYDAHVFANRVINTEAATTYLIKVRTLEQSEGKKVTITVRDPLPGEEPTTPIEIPFNGKSGKYTFDRPVNYEEDTLWYSIKLKKGAFTMTGSTGGAFELYMYSPGNLATPIATAEVVDLDYDEENEMYIYTYGIVDLEIPETDTYLFKLTDNAVDVEMTLTLDAAHEDGIEEVTLSATDGEQWYDLQGRPARKGLLIRRGEKIFLPR